MDYPWPMPDPAPGARTEGVSEKAVVLTVAAVQLVNILDFVMVMPLGPDFSKAIHIPESDLGWIAGAYTAAAAVSGLIGAFVLDRFDRRKALIVSMIGLIIGTAMGGLAQGFHSLLGARVLAGIFGGPATSVSLSIIADVVPPARRGRAMGIVMGAFGIASVVGVPVGLLLASALSWHAPFFAIAGLGAVVIGYGATRLPSMTRHIAERAVHGGFHELFTDRLVWMSYTMTATVMGAGFLLIPNLSAYVQRNLGFPRNQIFWLYLVGGTISVILTPLVGRLVDKRGSTVIGTLGSLMFVATVLPAFILIPHSFPVLALFCCFMMSMSFRNVAYNTLASKVPSPQVRARFMSIQSTVQHGAAAAGGLLSSVMLKTGPGGVLQGIPRLATVSLALTFVLPVLLFVVERSVKARAAAAIAAAAATTAAA